MEFLNHIWTVIAPYLAGVSVGGILTAVLYGCLKGAFAKTINKINVEKIAEEATNKGVNKVKEISFKHSIQPLVNSELDKITEQANNYIKSEIDKMDEKYNKIVDILDKFSAYFDNSVFVSDEVKQELKNAINGAKTKETMQIESTTNIVEEKPKEISKKSKMER